MDNISQQTIVPKWLFVVEVLSIGNLCSNDRTADATIGQQEPWTESHWQAENH